MLCVKTKIKPSEIAGIGLFAAEYIPRDTIVWKFNPNVDILLSKENIESLSDDSKEQVYRYAFLDKKYQKYMLCGDDARFFNHSENYNCNDELPDVTIAIRDILEGEELTVDYMTFYEIGDSLPSFL